MSIAPIHRDTRGEKPMVPPHLLQRILQKIAARDAKRTPAAGQDAWANIDSLAQSVEAAK